MSFPDHVWLANELVDASGALWEPVEMMIFPTMNCVVLHVGKRTSGCRDNPTRHAGVFQVLFITGLNGIPPLAYMWSRLPLQQQIQISCRCLFETVKCGPCHDSRIPHRPSVIMGSMQPLCAATQLKNRTSCLIRLNFHDTWGISSVSSARLPRTSPSCAGRRRRGRLRPAAPCLHCP